MIFQWNQDAKCFKNNFVISGANFNVIKGGHIAIKTQKWRFLRYIETHSLGVSGVHEIYMEFCACNKEWWIGSALVIMGNGERASQY